MDWLCGQVGTGEWDGVGVFDVSRDVSLPLSMPWGLSLRLEGVCRTLLVGALGWWRWGLEFSKREDFF
jgi:hypothetical protein